MTAQATLDQIKKQFAATIKRETGADVEVTFIAANRFSVYGTPVAVRKAHKLLDQGFTYTSFDQYPEDNEACMFYQMRES